MPDELEVFGTVERWGESFRVVHPGDRALQRFAALAAGGADTDTMQGLAATDRFISQCLHPDDLQAFDAACDRVRANGDEFLAVIQDIFRTLMGRPTGQSSDSSDGLPTTNENSAGGSSSRVIARLEGQGRPDLALLVSQAPSAA